MEVVGKVHLIGQSITVTQSYEKRELVVKTDEQYPQFISIEFPQGKCSEYIDKLKVGDEVKIGINLGGREWVNPQGETKYFNSIKGWKVEVLSTAPPTTPTQSKAGALLPGETDDDLPY